jgi:peroxin-5
LAVSYTNEGQRASANTMLEKWIELGESGQASLDQGDILAAEAKDRNMTTKEKRDNLVSRLIDIACRSPDEVDPDVQIALGVMFNASEVSAAEPFGIVSRD